jgi:pimeloyl-ACP methyl ester carboxylesterase
MDSGLRSAAGFVDGLHPLEEGLKLSYRDYAPAYPGSSKLPAICLHGLTRNARDFEDLAPLIAGEGRRVIVPSMRGRGLSSWDPKPERYNPGVYAADVKSLLDALGVPRAVFVGTSLGGVITMVTAATEPALIGACVLNDIGTVVDPAGLDRIRGFVGRGAPAKNWAEAGRMAREVNGVAFPKETGEDFWIAFARRTRRQAPDGSIVSDYDPAIGEAMRAAGPPAADLWGYFDLLASIPTLVVRGALSDLLSKETVAAMKARKPDLRAAEIPDVGHAPMLTEPAAVAALEAFLAEVP